MSAKFNTYIKWINKIQFLKLAQEELENPNIPLTIILIVNITFTQHTPGLDVFPGKVYQTN